jgi:proline iminopeptidase
MKKVIGIIVITVAVIILVAGGIFLYFISQMGKPLYTPGKLSENAEKSGITLRLPSQEDVEENYWKVDEGIKIYHFSDGEGEPILVLHGGPAYGFESEWEGLSKLNDEYKFIYYHQRGCGKSTKPIKGFKSKDYKQLGELSNTLGFKAQIADIEKIRKILDKDKLTLVGHSFGGLIATLYAVEFHENVNALILISPADVIRLNPNKDSLFDLIEKNLTEERKKDFVDFQKRLFDFSPKLFEKTEKDLINQQVEFAQFFKEALGKKNQHILNIKPELYGGWTTMAYYVDMGSEHDWSKHLSKVKAPVLIIGGEEDITKNTHADYVKYLPKDNVEVKMITGATHFSFYEKPEEFAKIVKPFLNKCIKSH